MHIFYTNNIIKEILNSRSIGEGLLPEGPLIFGGGGRLTLKLVPSGEVLTSVSSEWGGLYECVFGVGRSLRVCLRNEEVLMSVSSEWGGPYKCVFGVGRSLRVCLRSGEVLSSTKRNKGCVTLWPCAFALKSILRRPKEEELWKLKYFTMPK